MNLFYRGSYFKISFVRKKTVIFYNKTTEFIKLKNGNKAKGHKFRFFAETNCPPLPYPIIENALQ